MADSLQCRRSDEMNKHRQIRLDMCGGNVPKMDSGTWNELGDYVNEAFGVSGMDDDEYNEKLKKFLNIDESEEDSNSELIIESGEGTQECCDKCLHRDFDLIIKKKDKTIYLKF